MRCLSPTVFKSDNPNQTRGYRTASVPCGKCAACLHNKREEWSLRLRQHAFDNTSPRFGLFVTLTYANEHIPSSGLCKTDVQEYLKRLRYSRSGSSKSDISYFLCGEYGSQTKRPHYHAIIFFEKTDGKETNQVIQNWPFGYVHVGSVTPLSIAYTTKYMINFEDEDESRNDLDYPEGKTPPFRLMSKGIGKCFVHSYADWYEINPVNYVPERSGVKKAMPRYYREKLGIKGRPYQDVEDVDPLLDIAMKVAYTRQLKKRSKNNCKF